MIARIHERKPGAEIVVQSLLPTYDDAKNRDLVQPVNANLRAFALQTKGLRYLDLYSSMFDAKGGKSASSSTAACTQAAKVITYGAPLAGFHECRIIGNGR